MVDGVITPAVGMPDVTCSDDTDSEGERRPIIAMGFMYSNGDIWRDCRVFRLNFMFLDK